MYQIPLAWRNLTHDPKRLAIAIGGIVFAVLLMFTQTGFRNGLFDSTVSIIDKIEGDVVIYSRARFSLVAYYRFNADVLSVAESIEGVEKAEALYLENPWALLRNTSIPTPQKTEPIRVIAFNHQSGLMKSISQADIERMNQPQTALFDSKSKPSYGFGITDVEQLQNQQAELAGKKLQLVGTFDLGTDFANDGNLLMSRENFARYFPYRNRGNDPLEIVDLGIIKLADQANREQVIAQLKKRLPGDVYVESIDQYRNREVRFWSQSTPIGMIFLIGTIMGFAVGIIICYQVLATDISDHLPEFATLKAMGYTNWYFVKLIVAQAIYLSILGFIPGLILSYLLFQIAAEMTGLVMIMTLPRILIVFGLTLLMCTISGLSAVRKLVSADPASLF